MSGSSKRYFRDPEYPYDRRMKRKAYEKLLRKLQIELLKMQGWVRENDERIVILFEGRDAAGKGGTIKRFTEHLNPRGARAVALPKPTEDERGQWYVQRYIAHLPTHGQIVFFDRSWYNRAGVEPVMGFCTPAEYRLFLRAVPDFERALIEDGIRLFKFWFAVGPEEQKHRFDSRRTDPLKQWKLSPMDVESMKRFDQYTLARDRMFFMTHTRDAPWHVIRSDDKRRARINAIRIILGQGPYEGRDEEVVAEPDPKIVGAPQASEPDNDEFLFAVKTQNLTKEAD
jgi:polyphosphate kinase 2